METGTAMIIGLVVKTLFDSSVQWYHCQIDKAQRKAATQRMDETDKRVDQIEESK
jgi:hypothetical protein